MRVRDEPTRPCNMQSNRYVRHARISFGDQKHGSKQVFLKAFCNTVFLKAFSNTVFANTVFGQIALYTSTDAHKKTASIAADGEVVLIGLRYAARGRRRTASSRARIKSRMLPSHVLKRAFSCLSDIDMPSASRMARALLNQRFVFALGNSTTSVLSTSPGSTL